MPYWNSIFFSPSTQGPKTLIYRPYFSHQEKKVATYELKYLRCKKSVFVAIRKNYCRSKNLKNIFWGLFQWCSTMISATSKCILVPFERYGRPKKALKKVLLTLFPHIFQAKTIWNIVYEYLKTKIFSRDTNILPQMHGTSNIFGPSATTIESFWVSLNYPILNFKKTVRPKNVCMRYIPIKWPTRS